MSKDTERDRSLSFEVQSPVDLARKVRGPVHQLDEMQFENVISGNRNAFNPNQTPIGDKYFQFQKLDWTTQRSKGLCTCSSQFV